jgi:hypothetical protein
VSKLVKIDAPGLTALLGDSSVVYQHDTVNVIYTDHERHSLDEANRLFGVRDWRHMSVSLIGWQYLGSNSKGEMPLPTWYELSHLVYGEHPELSWDRKRDVLQFLPPPSEYVSIAEALHLWQPR